VYVNILIGITIIIKIEIDTNFNLKIKPRKNIFLKINNFTFYYFLRKIVAKHGEKNINFRFVKLPRR